MDAVKEYLLSVSAAALMCGCVCVMFEKKGAVSTLIKTLCGIFITLTVLRPAVDLDLGDLESYLSISAFDSEAVVEEGVEAAAQAQQTVIKERCEEYVYDKAADLECQVQVAVCLSPEAPYAPISIQISGHVSPYAKSQLCAFIEDDLGVAKEDQIWSS